MTATPAASRSSTSSRRASATWAAVSPQRLVVADERPGQHRDRPGQHALDRAVGQALRVPGPFDGHRRRPGHVAGQDRRPHVAGCRTTAPSRARSPRIRRAARRSTGPCRCARVRRAPARPARAAPARRPPMRSRRASRPVPGLVEPAGAPIGPGPAQLGGLRERADGGGRQQRQVERGLLCGAALVVRTTRVRSADESPAARTRTPPSRRPGAAARSASAAVAAASSSSIAVRPSRRPRPSVVTWSTFWSANASHERSRGVEIGSSVDIVRHVLQRGRRARRRPRRRRDRGASRECARRSRRSPRQMLRPSTTPADQALPARPATGSGTSRRGSGRWRCPRWARPRARATPRRRAGRSRPPPGSPAGRSRAQHRVGARGGRRKRRGVDGGLSLHESGLIELDPLGAGRAQRAEQLGVHRSRSSSG